MRVSLSLRCTALLVVCLPLTSCSTTRWIPLNDPTAPDAVGTRPIAISGYVTADGHHQVLEAKMYVQGDSLRFVIPDERRWHLSDAEGGEFTLPRSAVVLVEPRGFQQEAQGVALAAGVLVLAMGWVVAFALLGRCLY